MESNDISRTRFKSLTGSRGCSVDTDKSGLASPNRERVTAIDFSYIEAGRSWRLSVSSPFEGNGGVGRRGASDVDIVNRRSNIGRLGGPLCASTSRRT